MHGAWCANPCPSDQATFLDNIPGEDRQKLRGKGVLDSTYIKKQALMRQQDGLSQPLQGPHLLEVLVFLACS